MTDNHNLISEGAGLRPDSIVIQDEPSVCFEKSEQREGARSKHVKKNNQHYYFYFRWALILITHIRLTIGDFKLGRMGKCSGITVLETRQNTQHT